MPLFKKSPSDSGTLSEAHRKVLHRCRMLLVKDLDIAEILENMTSDEGFKPEVRDHIMSFPTREQRVGIFLDKLELRGDRVFSLFIESVKEKYKHVHYVLEETLRTIDDLQDSHQRERAAVTGDTVRKLLKNKLNHKSEQSHGSESADDLDMIICENSSDEYIDCYSIPMRGRLQKESWIKHEIDPKMEEIEEAKESTFMASLVTDIQFLKIDPSTIPPGVKMPPKYCTVFVVDNTEHSICTVASDEKATMDVEVTESQNTTDSSSLNNFQDILDRQQKAVEKQKSSSLPDIAAPPVPPKPEHLPSLSITAKPKSVRSHIKEIEGAGSSVQPPPRTTSKTQSAMEKPRPLPKPKHKAEHWQTASKESEEDLHGGPPLPPRGSPLSSLNIPPQIPALITEKNRQLAPVPEPLSQRNRSLSNVTEESAGKADDEATDTPLDNVVSEVAPVANGNLSAADTVLDDSQDSDHTLPYTREKAVEEIAQPQQEEIYEPIAGAPKPLETNLDEDSDDPLSHHVEVESGWEDDDKRSGSFNMNGTESGHSRECSPEQHELPDPAGSSKTSGDSMCSTNPGSLGDKSSMADSFENIALPMGKVGHKGGKTSRPPMLLPRSESHLNADNESSEETSYYEDIEIFDKAPSPSAKSNMLYLDPKSYTKNLDGKDFSSVFFETAPKLPVGEKGKGLQFSSWEITGKLCMHRHELLIADLEESMQQGFIHSDGEAGENTEVVVGQYSKFHNTKLAFDKEGHAFYVPSALLKKYGDPEGEPWFYPVEMSSRQATLFLSMEQQEGCFVVYRSTRKIPGIAYNLSVCRENGDVVHYHIVKNIHGDVMIEGHDHSFMNIRDLVQYFQKNKSQLATQLRRPLKEARMPVTPGYHYHIKFEINRNNLNLTGKVIGRGNFGVVCAGMYQRIHVAVKVLQKADATVMEEDDFVAEAKVMTGLKHDHVVRLIGISCTARPFFLVTEYVTRGNLRDCLRTKVIPPDNIDTLFDICIQVTSAMFYLESIKYVLHRDVAARNFLVASDMCIKLADFGRAHYVLDDCYQARRNENIAIKWAAPEVLSDSIYSTKSDVWSLGIVFWEVFSSGERPYTSLSGEQTAVYVCEGGRLDKPPGCASDLAAMMKSCWRENPDERPSFATLYDKLKSKSSIYYAGPSRDRNKKRNSSLEPANRFNSVSNSPAPPKIKSPHRPLTPTGKHKKTIALDSKTEEYVKEMLSQPNEDSRRYSGEKLHTSSSETSLVSAQGILDPNKDDLTRGNKIRKSLRNLIKKPKKKGSQSDNCKDGENVPNSPQIYYA